MNEVWLVIGCSEECHSPVHNEWMVAAYPDEQTANLHRDQLNNTLKKFHIWITRPLEREEKNEIRKAIAHLDPAPELIDLIKPYSVRKVPFVRHPDEFQDKFGKGG